MSGAVPISWADYSKCDATDLARLVANGEVSAKELATITKLDEKKAKMAIDRVI